MVLPDGRLSVSRWGTGNLGILDPATNLFAYSGGPRYKTALGKYTTAFPAPGDEKGTPEMVIAGGLGIDQSTYGPTNELLGDVWAIEPATASATGTDWQPQPSLNVPRRNAVATLLPDGSAVVLGGGDQNDRVPLAQIRNPGSQPQRHVELWDLTTRRWTLGPAADVPRGYHSSAVLLPDGRVLTRGDDWVSYVLDPDHTDAYDGTFQIYSPPYLFKGARPVIDALPARADYGGSFAVAGHALDGHTVASATLVAPGSVTHAFDSNQRVLKLPIRGDGNGGYRVTAPVSANAAPPGDYMLFLLDERGVPSVGQFLRIASEHASATVPVEPTATPTPTAVPAPTPVPTPAAGQPTPGGSPSNPAPIAPAPTTGSEAPLGTPTQTPATPTQTPATPRPATPTLGVHNTPQSGSATPGVSKPAATVKAPPAAKLTGRRLAINVALTPTGSRCPAGVSVAARASGRKTVKRLKPRAARSSAGKRICQLKSSMTLSRTPAKRASVRVTFSGKGVKARTVSAVR